VALYHFRNGIPLTTAAAANFTRGELATALRKVIDLINFFSLILLFQIWGFFVFNL
jgi:20S proteasome subunit beta 4